MYRLLSSIILMFVLILTGNHNISFAATSAYQQIQEADHYIDQSIQLAQQGKMQDAQKEFQSYQDHWPSIENQVKQTSVKAYSDIEMAMGQVSFAFAQNFRNISFLATRATVIRPTV